MTIESIIAIILTGMAVGYIVSILFNSGSFNTVVNVLAAIPGAALAGAIIPDTLLVNPPIIEQMIRAALGASLTLVVMNLLRKV